jgi:hypothetical protein
MADTPRSEKMNVSLSSLEREIRDALVDHYGVDAAGIMRMGLLELGRHAGITADTLLLRKKKNAPKH